jgi:hypothetical protein
MSTLPQIDPATATGPAAEALAETRKALGSVPNMAKAMANSPALLKGWLALSGALGGGVDYTSGSRVSNIRGGRDRSARLDRRELAGDLLESRVGPLAERREIRTEPLVREVDAGQFTVVGDESQLAQRSVHRHVDSNAHPAHRISNTNRLHGPLKVMTKGAELVADPWPSGTV